MTGIIGMNNSEESSPNDAIAIAEAPPHGVIFITPIDNIATVANTSRFIPSRLYSGSNAEHVMIYVVVPSPSKATIIERTAVPRTIFKGSPFTTCRILAINGSKRPYQS